MKASGKALRVEYLGNKMTGQCVIPGAWSTCRYSVLGVIQHMSPILPILHNGSNLENLAECHKSRHLRESRVAVVTMDARSSLNFSC